MCSGERLTCHQLHEASKLTAFRVWLLYAKDVPRLVSSGGSLFKDVARLFAFWFERCMPAASGLMEVARVWFGIETLGPFFFSTSA